MGLVAIIVWIKLNKKKKNDLRKTLAEEERERLEKGLM
jgi:hypothetical protein